MRLVGLGRKAILSQWLYVSSYVLSHIKQEYGSTR